MLDWLLVENLGWVMLAFPVLIFGAMFTGLLWEERKARILLDNPHRMSGTEYAKLNEKRGQP